MVLLRNKTLKHSATRRGTFAAAWHPGGRGEAEAGTGLAAESELLRGLERDAFWQVVTKRFQKGFLK